MVHQDGIWENMSRQLTSTVRAVSSSATAAVSSVEDRRRDVMAGFTARRPPFASTSLVPVEARPAEKGAGKPKNEGGKRKGKKAAAKEMDLETFRAMPREQKKELLAKADPAAVEALRNALQGIMLEQTPVTMDGKKTNMLELAKQWQRERHVHSVGGDEPTLRSEAAPAQRAEMPVSELRPGAPKEQLRPDEHNALPLDRLCSGNAFSPAPVVGMRLGGRRDFTFGIFAKGKSARKLLKAKWAGRNPDEVVTDQEFYDDVMTLGPYLELTLMAMPVRRLPLEDTVGIFRGRLRHTLSFLSGGSLPEEQSVAVDSVASRFTVKKLGTTSLLEKDQVAKGTQFIFSTGREGQLSIEGITAAPLRDRRAVFFGSFPNPALAPALMAQFLGPDPIDEEAKLEAGQALVFAINGFKFGHNQQLKNKNQYLVEDEDSETGFPMPVVEDIAPSPSLFQIPAFGRRRLLLDGVARETRSPAA